MILTPAVVHFCTVAITVVLSSFGTALGQAIAGADALKSLNRQEVGKAAAMRALIIGLALIESGGILALLVAFLLLTSGADEITWGMAWAEMGIGIALGFSAIAVAVASGFAVKAACSSIMRQPFFAQNIVTLMLISQSMIEAPVIFSFIVALMIKSVIHPHLEIYEGVKLFSAGLVIGLGCIGPSIGQAIFTTASCSSVGTNRKAYKSLFAFSLLNQAIIETPVLFCLLLAILLIFRPITVPLSLMTVTSFFAAAFSMGLGSFGTGASTGYVASRSCYQLAQSVGDYSVLFRSTLLAQVFIESSAIYALIISLLLIMRAG